jgi:hypothetical protein
MLFPDELARLVDIRHPLRNFNLRETVVKMFGSIELGLQHVSPIRADEAPFGASAHGSQAFAHFSRLIESRCNRDLAGFVDVSAFPADLHTRKSFAKAVRQFKARLDDERSALIDESPQIAACTGASSSVKPFEPLYCAGMTNVPSGLM